jgi:hypothetical protein
MNWFNTNAIHNYFNAVILAVAATPMDLLLRLMTEAMAWKVVAAVSIAKLTMNIARDGVTGVVKVQPPVVSVPVKTTPDP